MLAESCSMAWRSSSVRVLERTGRNGAGEPARDVRNYHGLESIVTRSNESRRGGLTELAALKRAIKLAWTTS
jgi:hypothetical protein